MKTKYLAYAVAAIILASCSNDEDFGPQDNLKDTPITIASAGVAELSTRAISDDNALVGGNPTLGLYVYDAQEKYKADHELYTYNNSSGVKKWEFDRTGSKDKDQMLFNGSSFDWIAYSPYSITAGATTHNLYDATTFSVPTDGNYGGGPEESTYYAPPSVDGSQYDLLWGKGTSTSATLNLALNHVLTKITVNITALGSEIADGTTISSIKIGGSIPTGTLNLTGATTAAEVVTIPAENPASAADITALKLETANGTYVASYEALIIPQTAALKLMVKMADNSVFTKTLSSMAFESGNHYIINLQVGMDKKGINIVSVTKWTPHDISGGVAEYDGCTMDSSESEEVIAKFKHYFCDSNGNMAIHPLDEYSHIWAVGTISGERACEIFSDITGLSVTAKKSYTYCYESEDGRVNLRIEGNLTADENVYATLYVTIPGYEDIDQIKIVTLEYLRQVIDDEIPVII